MLKNSTFASGGSHEKKRHWKTLDSVFAGSTNIDENCMQHEHCAGFQSSSLDS